MRTSVLFVCLGNICRSPLAEAIFEKLIHEKGLESNIKIDSCGISDYHQGNKADIRTRENAESHGINITHRSRPFTVNDFSEFEYILAMDSQNIVNILGLRQGNFKSKIFKMRDFDPLDINADVPDPYFGGINGFEDVYQILLRSCTGFLEYLLEEHKDSKAEL